MEQITEPTQLPGAVTEAQIQGIKVQIPDPEITVEIPVYTITEPIPVEVEVAVTTGPVLHQDLLSTGPIQDLSQGHREWVAEEGGKHSIRFGV